MKKITIPESGGAGQIMLDIERNIVIVGANGAGKSRFGSKVEQMNPSSKRISAQRHLQLTEVVQKLDYQTADSQLKGSYKNQPPIQPQNDYQQVLISLFAQESSRDQEYVARSRASTEKVQIPQSIKEKVVGIWNFVFPHRVLKLENDRIRAINDSSEFSGSEMSDGEKVGLYLISQILLAEKDCVLVIDEPELHLHKALMVRLWNKLEECRADCSFVYITHDLDFAVSKPSSKVIWIKSFKNNTWDWQEIDPNGVIPENLFLEVLGSRKPILFVEGDKGSLDIQVYQICYEDFTVIPCGSCEKVIESVKGLKGNAFLHDKQIFGIIDKDFRPEAQIAALQSDGVYCVSLNQVENLFLLPDVIDLICEHLFKKEKKEEIVAEIKKIYDDDKEQIAFHVSKYRMHRHWNEKFGSVKNASEYEQFKQDFFRELDEQITVSGKLESGADLVEILKIYPHKGLLKQVQGKIGLTKDGYKDLVLNLLLSLDKGSDVKKIFKPYLPEINVAV